MTLYNTKEMAKGRKTNVSGPELSLKRRTYLFYACGTSKCDNLDRCSRNMIKIKISMYPQKLSCPCDARNTYNLYSQ